MTAPLLGRPYGRTGLQRSAILLAATLAGKPPTRIQLCGRLAVELAGRDLTARAPRRSGPPPLHLPGRQPRAAGGPRRADRGAVALACARRRRRLAERPALPAAGRARPRRADGRERDPARSSRPTHGSTSRRPRRRSTAPRPPSTQERLGPWLGTVAVALFTARRGFLPGEDLPWAEEHRRRLEEIRLAALECYAAVALGVGGTELAPGERAPVSSSPRRRSASARTRC